MIQIHMINNWILIKIYKMEHKKVKCKKIKFQVNKLML